MVSKAQIKFIKSLGLLKFRQKYDKFTAEGLKTVIEFVKSRKFKPEKVYIQDEELHDKLFPWVSTSDIELVTSMEMAQMTTFKTPSPILAVFSKNKEPLNLPDLTETKSIYLDDIQDPGNLGTILRVADWFGITHVMRSVGSADFYHPKVIQASMGSLCNLNLYHASLKEIIAVNAGIPVYGSFLDGPEITNHMFSPKSGILIIGNEGHGISKENEAFVTHRISIGGDPDRIAESLNAAIACGILCHQWTL